MAEPWRIHVVVFDLDDTLYPERDYVLSGFSAVDQWLATHCGVAGFSERAQTLFSAGHRGRIFDTALAQLGQPVTPARIAELVDVYRQHDPTLRLFPDAETVLRQAASDFQFALITDGYRLPQEKKITALNLTASIPCRIVTDALGREFWKPSLEPYRRVMAHYRGEAENYVYVADNPHKDFIGARRLGWKTVRVRRQGCEYSNYEPTPDEKADVDIPSLLDLMPLLVPARHTR